MVVSENIFVHLYCDGLMTVARHIEETLVSSFAKGNPIRIHTDKETGKATVYEDPDKRTITELIKVS